jgi:hypothetical protein
LLLIVSDCFGLAPDSIASGCVGIDAYAELGLTLKGIRTSNSVEKCSSAGIMLAAFQ